MDIETKLFRIVSSTAGGFNLTNKRLERTAYLVRAPSAHRLAMMHENQFNREAAVAMNYGYWE
jgi:hypothetical protein